MAVRSSIVTVGTTPTALTPGADADENGTYRDVALANTGLATVYLGGPTVTTANGFPLGAGAGLSLDALPITSPVYAIVGSGTVTVAVLEVGV